MNKDLFSKSFSVGEEVKSGANPNRKNAATVRILAIESDGVRYESTTSKNHHRYFLKYTHLEALLSGFEENPKSITDSVNKIWKKAKSPSDHATEAYSYGIARAFREMTGGDIFLSQGESLHKSNPVRSQGFMEGGRVAIWVERSERASSARSQCIEHYGAWCHVCKFNFESTYGAIGKKFIHVHHHREQLSSSPMRRRVDAIKDLIPLCPNCHAMLHSKTEMLSLSVLRKKMEEAVRP